VVVLSTREGLVGQITSSLYRIDSYVSFVALPSVSALWKFIKVTNPANGNWTYAQVLDVGPHSDHDDDYVFHGARPLAESGISRVGGVDREAKNKAGIDLGEKVWNLLGMTDNSDVDWEFI